MNRTATTDLTDYADGQFVLRFDQLVFEAEFDSPWSLQERRVWFDSHIDSQAAGFGWLAPN